MLTMKKWQLLSVIATCGFLRGPSLTACSAINEFQLLRISRNADEASGSCILPPIPQHGSYSIVGETAVPIPGAPVKEFTFLDIHCVANYVLSSADRVFCSAGKWSEENITCLKTCKPLQSSSIQYRCNLNGVPVSCEKPTRAGTRAFLSCKENYKPVVVPGETIYCMSNGEWEHSFLLCNPECGTTPMGSKFAINAYKAHQHQFPWHAAIYDKENSPVPNEPVFICGGTIVSANKIVSAAHCFWDVEKDKTRSAESFAVGYGKEFSGWKNTDDKFGIYTDVKQLIIHSDYRDILQSYAQDIAIVVLLHVIEFNQMIKPICVDWTDDSEDSIEPGVLGKVPGWGKITKEGELSPQLMQLNMPVVSRKTCKSNSPRNFRSYVTADKICAGFGNGSSLCHGDSGGGLILYDDVKNAFYLKGVVSTGPTDDDGSCDSYKYTLFTSVSQFLPWLQDQKAHGEPEVFICTSNKRIIIQDMCDGIVDCDDGSDESEELCAKVEDVETSAVLAGSCILPAKPGNGSYTIYASKTVPLAWTATKNGTMLEYKCNKDFVLTIDETVYCSEGQWLPTLPRCKKPCEPLQRYDGTFLKCMSDKTISVSCNGPIAPGTEVSVTCRSGFKRPEDFFNILTCGEDSKWNFPLVNCESECGRTYEVETRNEKHSLEIENEIEDKYGEEYLEVARAPWRAYIYEKVPDADPVLLCSGTIVDTDNDYVTIITDKKCFTDAEGNLRDSSLFAVGMAKLSSEWRNEKDKFAIYSDIVYDYEEEVDDEINTIWFLRTKKALQRSYLIRPVCIYHNPMVLNEAEYSILVDSVESQDHLRFSSINSEETEICPDQNGRGIISSISDNTARYYTLELPMKSEDSLTDGTKFKVTQFIFKNYLIGILSFDKNKEHQCRAGIFNATSIFGLE